MFDFDVVTGPHPARSRPVQGEDSRESTAAGSGPGTPAPPGKEPAKEVAWRELPVAAA